jgi:thioredoxin reductase (NADPH)
MTVSDVSEYDVIIVGAGPSGLSVAIECRTAGLRYCVIEKGAVVNSIQHFPSEMTFFSTPELLEIGGIPFTSARMRPTRTEGLEYYTRVAEHLRLDLKLFETVNDIVPSGSNYTVATSKGKYTARLVVLATGYFDHPNLLGVPGEELPNVSHYYTEPYPYFRQRVIVIGAKNSAAIAALELYRHGAEVTLVHRGDGLSEKIKYWILPDIRNRIAEGAVRALFNAVVTRITPEDVTIRHTDGREEVLASDFVFVLTGYHPDDDFLRHIGLPSTRTQWLRSTIHRLSKLP